MRDQLTRQQEEFCRLVDEGNTFVAAYRQCYPPRNRTRSAGAERVAAKRVAHHPRVSERIQQLRQLRPDNMRLRANAVLNDILAKRLDPRYRRTAIDVLKQLDEQERAASKADREAYLALLAQKEALDAMESGERRRGSTAAKPKASEQKKVDVDEIIDEIDRLVAERRTGRAVEGQALSAPVSPPDDPQPAAKEEWPAAEEKPVVNPVPPATSGFRLVRKPGHFGGGGWMRVPIVS
jgi:hypothetical protein